MSISSPELLRLLRERDAEDIFVFGGGVIPDGDIDRLKTMGVVEVFTPGTRTDDVITFLRERIAQRSGISVSRARPIRWRATRPAVSAGLVGTLAVVFAVAGKAQPATQPSADGYVVSADAAESFVSPDGLTLMTLLLNPASVPPANAALSLIAAAPGAVVPEHLHDDAAEILYILEGGGQMTVGSQTYAVAPGMAVFIPSGDAPLLYQRRADDASCGSDLQPARPADAVSRVDPGGRVRVTGRGSFDPIALAEGVLRGDVRSTARLMRLTDDSPQVARPALAVLYPQAGNAHVVGITGNPGSGKSTLVSQLIGAYRADGVRVGVVAVDPSSPFSGGANFGRPRAHDGPFGRPGGVHSQCGLARCAGWGLALDR